MSLTTYTDGTSDTSTTGRMATERQLLLVDTRNLTKRYGTRIAAVDNLNLCVRRGEVYGFLGPNGAGKTTTLRMLLGLIHPTAGTARVLGLTPGAPAGLARVGALVESPAFYPYLSGRDNLRVLARYCGAGEERITEALAQVDLSVRAKDKFKTYSLGMKQRLGVAAALLKNPDLLILDEPTNGLDPQGIAEMRTLIRSIGQGTRTVMLSSHLLGEVEQICDRVGVIQRGRLVAEGTLAELRGPRGLLVRAEPIDDAWQAVQTLSGIESARIADGAIWLATDPSNAAAINRALVGAGLAVSELHPATHSLEEKFFELIEGPQGTRGARMPQGTDTLQGAAVAQGRGQRS
jgi:ABC-type multidrug transport system ATPase subunit